MVQTPTLHPIRRKQQSLMRLPMPTGGLNFMAGTMDMGPMDSYLMDNLIPRATGLEVRKGWRYWVTEKMAGEVRTLMTYNAQNPANSRLFIGAAVNTGFVYEATAQNATPALVLSPSTQASVPGEWYWTNFVTPALACLCMVSHGAGYYLYDNTNGWREVITGTGTLQVSFPDSTTTKDLAFIWTWKRRIWFLKKNSTTAYYLPIDSLAGVAQMFDFGPQLVRGGPLAYGTRWTFDAGDGIDDSLILVSELGDVLVYEGTDPANASTFQQKGTWYIGRVPYGRRGFGQYGGDVLLLNEFGMIKISDLVAGRGDTTEIDGTLAAKINPLLAGAISNYLTQKYWFVLPYSTEELLIVGSPYINIISQAYTSFAMNSHTAGWCTISNIDIYCATVFQGNLMVGTSKGEIIQAFYGYRDGDSADGTLFGNEVTGRMQGSFLDYGSPNNNKRMLRIKMYGNSEGIPAFLVVFKDEYNLQEFLNVSAPASRASSLWDVGIWDESQWLAGVASFRKWIGVAAYGKKLSLQLVVRGAGPTTFTDFEVLFESAQIGL